MAPRMVYLWGRGRQGQRWIPDLPGSTIKCGGENGFYIRCEKEKKGNLIRN